MRALGCNAHEPVEMVTPPLGRIANRADAGTAGTGSRRSVALAAGLRNSGRSSAIWRPYFAWAFGIIATNAVAVPCKIGGRADCMR